MDTGGPAEAGPPHVRVDGDEGPEQGRATLTAVGAVAALMAAAFVYVTTEALPIGLLPLLSADLHVSLSTAGLLVSVYGLAVAVTAIPLTRLAGGIPRRWLLAGLLAVFVVATGASAAAPSYQVLMAARVVTALSQAVFWSVAGVAAAGLFPPRVRGRATTVVVAGASLAPVLGVPAGVWIGQQAGWRVAFLAVGALALVALVAVVLLFPTLAPDESHSATGAAPDRRRFWSIVASTGLAVTGMFTAYTYITPFLTDVSGFRPAALSPLLLLYGAAGVLGVIVTATVVDRAPRAVTLGTVALLAVALLALYVLGPVPAAAIALVCLWGFAFPPLPASLGARVLEVAPGSTDTAFAIVTVAFNVGIGGGALVGGFLVAGAGVRGTALAGGLLVAAALAVVLFEPRTGRRPRPAQIQ
jgi:DHA1 family inner membrane transport protein